MILFSSAPIKYHHIHLLLKILFTNHIQAQIR